MKRTTLAIMLILCVLFFCGCSSASVPVSGNTMIMKVGDRVITGDEYQYWVLQNKMSYEQSYGRAYWSDSRGRELGKAILGYVNDYIIERCALLSIAKDKGLELSGSELSELQAQYDAELAGVEDVQKYLSEIYVHEDSYFRICFKEERILNRLIDYLYNEAPEFIPAEEELQAYAAEKNVVTVRQIMINNPPGGDSEGKRSLAETVRKEAAGGADFGELAGQYSDSTVEYLTFSTDDESYAAYVREAAVELAEGEISPVLEYSDEWQGWYLVLMRVETDREQLLSTYKEEKIKEYIDSYSEGLSKEYCEGFDRIKITDVNWTD